MATIKREQRKKGSVWSVRWYDATGRERKKSFSLKWEAEEHVARVCLQIDDLEDKTGSSKALQPEEFSFRDFAEIWFEQYCKVHTSQSTWIDYRLIIDKHLTPAFGDKRLAELKRVDLKTLQGFLTKQKGLKAKTVNNITNVAHKILQDCVTDWELIPHNPFYGYKRLRVPPPRWSFWEPEERDSVLAYCRNHFPNEYDFIGTMLHTGGRFGEVEALTGDSLDFQHRVITFRRKYYDKTKEFADYLKMGKKPRQVPMNSFLRDLLGKYRFVPAGKQLFPLKTRKSRRAVLDACAKGAGVKRIVFHEQRHTFASNLARANVSTQVIKELLGHSNLSQTQRYAHLSPEALKGVTEVLVQKTNDGSESTKAGGGGSSV